jgi:rSAM/selenodomain-associated transferase 2
MTVSVVIPTLNEATTVEATLRSVAAQTGPMERIVVDGGSADATIEIAQPHATVLETAPGRARQMNAGAERATGDALLFLHADTHLPTNGLSIIRSTLAQPDAEAGIFRLSFDRSSPLLRLYSWCTRWPWIRLAFGDRGLFVRRSAFEDVGGFPEWPLFEDLELAYRLHQRGRFCFRSEAVTTSARRFEQNGYLRQQLRNLRLWLHYISGTPPERLTHLYPYDGPGST